MHPTVLLRKHCLYRRKSILGDWSQILVHPCGPPWQNLLGKLEGNSHFRSQISFLEQAIRNLTQGFAYHTDAHACVIVCAMLTCLFVTQYPRGCHSLGYHRARQQHSVQSPISIMQWGEVSWGNIPGPGEGGRNLPVQARSLIWVSHLQCIFPNCFSDTGSAHATDLGNGLCLPHCLLLSASLPVPTNGLRAVSSVRVGIQSPDGCCFNMIYGMLATLWDWYQHCRC
jgi:hypothetical protein